MKPNPAGPPATVPPGPSSRGEVERPTCFQFAFGRAAAGGTECDLMEATAGWKQDGYVLLAICFADRALAVVASRMPLEEGASERQQQLLAAAEHAMGWRETLAVALACEPGRIEWAAVDVAGRGFTAVRQGARVNWLRLQDLAPPRGGRRAHLADVFAGRGVVVASWIRTLSGAPSGTGRVRWPGSGWERIRRARRRLSRQLLAWAFPPAGPSGRHLRQP